ncbi:hypothetical protein MLD38_007146 [Melastoma candidum]|uniref:Uncharacterized protein n=1 Tax=Melastoma candidum TaxID=119954 RepID=A0ACB9RPU9_9MYRT|nr:hypothetical protein MLD38_007146 [Melastoma candidum]
MAKPRKVLCQPRNDKSGHNISVEYNDIVNKTEGGVLALRFNEEESHPELRGEFYKGIDLNPFHRNVSTENPGKESSLYMQKEQDYDSSMVLKVDAGYTCKTCSSVLQNVDDTGVSHSMVPDERTKDCVTERICDHCNGVDFRVPRSGLGSDNSKNLESTDDDSSITQLRAEPSMDSAFEQPNSTSLTEMIPAITDVETLKADTSAINSPHGQSRIGTSRSSKRFLIFSKRSREYDSLEDLVSTVTSEGDEEEIFTEVLVLEEQVQSPRFPVHSSMGRIKRKGGNSRGRSLKANGSCFLLSSLRCRGEDTNPRQPIPRERIRR